MEAASNASAGQWSGGPELRTQCHQSGHLGFGYLDFFPAELG
jgi:hypothetical protein